MQKILIDADTGIDDSIAILYALKQPDVQVVGITTSFGNTTAPQAAENTLRLSKMSGVQYEVPVAIGENKPLFGDWHGPEYHIHGRNGVGNVDLPETDQKVLDEHAVDFILRMVKEHREITQRMIRNQLASTVDFCGVKDDLRRVAHSNEDITVDDFEHFGRFYGINKSIAEFPDAQIRDAAVSPIV